MSSLDLLDWRARNAEISHWVNEKFRLEPFTVEICWHPDDEEFPALVYRSVDQWNQAQRGAKRCVLWDEPGLSWDEYPEDDGYNTDYDGEWYMSEQEEEDPYENDQ